jgi:hypothetical protein
MKVFYNGEIGHWYQSSVKDTVTFGGDKTLLPFRNLAANHSLWFELNIENQHAGPLIGILTARKTDGTLAGNSALFVKLQKKLLSLGGASYIFTSEDVQDNFINGYTYLPESNHWKKIKAPFPDLVYNRIPFRKVESEDSQSFFSILKQKNIPFFNPCFLDKFQLYCLFKNNDMLINHLPETLLVTDKQTFSAFLEKKQSIYLKPSRSAKGKGIFRLSLTETSHLCLEGLKEKHAYPTFADFWKEWERELIDKQYLIQEEIISAKYNGKKFDLRILTHADTNGYRVTGIGVRQAVEQDITTHVPNGGRLLPYHPFHSNRLDRFIAFLVDEIGKTLTVHYGFFGEFSIDVGISVDGNYYLYEVNSKPMSFDEPEIEERKIDQLCSLFFHLTFFSIAHEKAAPAEE